MIGDGLSTGPNAPANGFDVTVNRVVNGITYEIGSFIFSGPSMFETIYTNTGMLQAGDMIEILYGNNGDYRFDHGNVNVFITASSTPVPIPAAIWLLGSGLIGLIGLRRKFKK